MAAAVFAMDGAGGNVTFTCTADTGKIGQIMPQQAEMLCAAAERALESLPAPPNPPALHLIVTSANDRSAGLAGTWLFASGQERNIAPLRTSFFDITANPVLHERFAEIFFQTNPILVNP